MGLLLFYLFLIFGVSFFCSVLEAVLLFTPSSFVEVQKKEKKKAASIFKKLKQEIVRTLSSILSLNTIAHRVGAQEGVFENNKSSAIQSMIRLKEKKTRDIITSRIVCIVEDERNTVIDIPEYTRTRWKLRKKIIVGQKKIIILCILISSLSVLSAQKAIIKGRIFDNQSNEPIAFGALLIEGTQIGSISDLDGNFIFTAIEPGNIQLTVFALGFEKTTTKKISVQGGITNRIDISVNPVSIELTEVVVRVKSYVNNLTAPLSFQSISPKELEKSAGANRDVSRILQTLPGVSFTDPNRTDLIVRGGGPNENVFFLSGVEIPTINHFSTQGSSGGSVGIINPDFVREINFYTGAFPANRGSSLSSVMDIKQIDVDKDKWFGKASIGASDAALSAGGPLGEKGSILLSARRSYLQLLFQALQLPFLPTYNDAQAKLKFRFNTKNELTIIGLSACDKTALNQNIAEPTESQTYLLNTLPVFKHYNYTIGAVFKHFGTTFYDTWVLSRNWLRNQNYKYSNQNQESPKIYDYLSNESENKFRYERVWIKLPIELMVGAGLKFAHYDNYTLRQIPDPENNILKRDVYSSKLNIFGGQFFTQVSDQYFQEKLKASLGLSWAFNNYNIHMVNQFSPRVSLSYEAIKNFHINFNIGRYAQSPSYTSLGYRDSAAVLSNQKNIKPIYANHLIFGFDYRPKENIFFAIEGFYKFYQYYPISADKGISLAALAADFGSVGDEVVISTGNGITKGVEFTARITDWKGLSMAAIYTFFSSEFTNINGEYMPSAWDTRHLLNLMANYRLKSHWFFSARWRFGGGAPYSPINEELSSTISIWDIARRSIPDYARYNTLRFANSHQLDIRIDKEFYFKNWMFNLYIDIQNIYNFKNQGVAIYTNTNKQGEVQYKNLTQYALRPIDIMSGTILPTLGIILKF